MRAWKLQKAAELAEKHAEELAKKAQDASSPLTDFFADDQSVEVVRTDPFSRLHRRRRGVVERAISAAAVPAEPAGRHRGGRAGFMDDVFELEGRRGRGRAESRSLDRLRRSRRRASAIRRTSCAPPISAEAEYVAWAIRLAMMSLHTRQSAQSRACDATSSQAPGWEWQRRRRPDRAEDRRREAGRARHRTSVGDVSPKLGIRVLARDAATCYRRGLNTTVASGGSVTSIEAGRPWLSLRHGLNAAAVAQVAAAVERRVAVA